MLNIDSNNELTLKTCSDIVAEYSWPTTGTSIIRDTITSSAKDDYLVDYIKSSYKSTPSWISNKDEILDLLKKSGYSFNNTKWNIKDFRVSNQSFNLKSPGGKIINYLIKDTDLPIVFDLNKEVWLGEFSLGFIKISENNALILVSPEIPEEYIKGDVINTSLNDDLDEIVNILIKKYGSG